MTGIEIFLEILAGAGVTQIFGNPGTTELPLNDALARDARFRYVFGIQEIPIMAMADGYSMAGRRVAVINLHTACGLGNAMGMLYNAHVEGTPLLVTAGQQDRRLRLSEPVLEGDLVRVAAPWTKWSHEVQRVEDMAPAVRRAVQIATTPPTGPVFLSLPVDVQMEPHPQPDADLRASRHLAPPCVVDARVRPSEEALERAAELLVGARNPVILAGSRVTESGGVAELSAFAEQLGAPVFAEGTPSHGRLPMPSDHPLYRGVLPYWSDQIHACLAPFDVALAVGLRVLRLYIHRPPEDPLPRSLRLIQLDPVAEEIGKNVPPEIGMLGDPRTGLAELTARIARRQTATATEVARQRRAEFAAMRETEQQQLRREIAAQQAVRPMSPLVLMDAIGRVLPRNVAVVEEAITTHQNVWERLGLLRDAQAFFAHRGWALGWGMGCALGVKLAWPDRPVLALIGDGSALYGIQALWSAAHHRIPVTFVVPNNVQYKILKICGDVLALPNLRDPRCPGMEVTDPAVDFVEVARGFGVDSRRIDDPDELSDCVRESLASDRPRLLEVPIAR